MIGERLLDPESGVLDEQALCRHIAARRWFGSKSREIMHTRIVDGAVVRAQEPQLVVAIVEVRFHESTHELYQLLLGVRGSGDWDGETIAEADGHVIYDAAEDPELARALAEAMRDGRTIATREGTLELRTTLGGVDLEGAEPRPLGVEQSNTSIAYGDRLILKAYRRIEAGINPELELLRFLTERSYANIAALAGWYAYTSRATDATLGVLQTFVANGRDGWELALEELRSDPDAFLVRLRRLGEVTGTLHTVLASEPGEPDFCPEEPSGESLALLTATVDEEIENVFMNLPELDALAPIAGRGEEVRDRLRLLSHVGQIGRVIRHHGDYHLGQVLWDGEDWVLLDFEGEPARSLPERRRKRSPLRDVAGMLRSFAYAASASSLTHGVDAPPDWERRARDEFLDGYFACVDRSLVPAGEEAKRRLLSVFELEKAVYELRYEINNRPDWVHIPVAGILRMLEEMS